MAKVLWQGVFIDHPGVQFEHQPVSFTMGSGADQFVCLLKGIGPQYTHTGALPR